MRHLFSRYGGHAIIFGKGKASSLELPENQTLENMLSEHAFQMNGFSYLSSYMMMPEFMSPFDRLPNDALKLGDLDHPFLEVLMQYDIDVTTSIYFGRTKYCNVFALFIKTNLSPVEEVLGKMQSCYDLPIIIRVQGKSDDELVALRKEIYYTMICLLVYEMDLMDSSIDFRPARTAAGKMLDMDELLKKLEQIKTIRLRSELATVLTL